MAAQASAAPLRAAVYTRISNDPEGREKGVERQEQDCRALAEQYGYDVVAVFEENDVSASTRSRKPRPQYDELMARAKAGQIDVILAYSNSRLTRRPMEVEDIIRLHEHHGIRVRTVVSGDDDLSTADGRMVARIKGNVDAAEAERTSERVRRAKAQAVAEGRYRGGKRPYGFEKDGVTVVPVESAVIREATSAVLAGRSVRAIARELNERGVKTSQGAEWTQMSLRDVLIRPRNAGLLSKGQITHGDFEIIGAAVWDAIVPEETWRALFDLLTEPSRRTNAANNDTRWLGSGLYVCGKPTGEVDAAGHPIKCGARMRTSASGATASRPNHVRKVHYRCAASAHMHVMQAATDDHVMSEVAKLVRDPRIASHLQPAAVDLSAEREERADLTRRLESFERDYALGHITGPQLAKSTALVEAQIAKVDDRLAKAIRRNASSPIFNAADPGAAFLAAPIDVQRSVLASVLQVEIVPAVRTGVSWSTDRVRLYPLEVADVAGRVER
ncbi:recombinase family protein [Microbacterium sp. 20-116]|uniref:recombinase family protein n=1 Tax=Microbacterium sp. 20-116 TaxID=3239883 RepID=UPI0034E1F3FC